MDPDATVRLVGVILAGVPSLPLAACRYHDLRLSDDRIDGETRERHHQQYMATPICQRQERTLAQRLTLHDYALEAADGTLT